LITATEGTAVQGSYGVGAVLGEQFSVERDDEGRLRLEDEDGRAIVATNEGIALDVLATDDRDLWEPVYTGFGHYALFNSCTGLALGIDPDELGAGAPLIVSKYVGARAQQFRLIGLDE
jgi:hypothetical protein